MEFEFATYFDNVLVSEGGGWKGTNSQTLSFQTNAPNAFLHNAIARLIETGLPGYIKDANLVLSIANGKRFTLGVGFYNREQTNFMSMIEYPDGSVRLTVMQNKYYNARDYSSKKIGYTRTTAYQDWIITPQFDAVELAGFHDGLALVNLGGKPTKGKNLGGYTDYVKGGKFAFINRKGEIVIPWTKCDHAGGFRNGKAWFETKGVYTYIDKTGKVIKVQ